MWQWRNCKEKEAQRKWKANEDRWKLYKMLKLGDCLQIKFYNSGCTRRMKPIWFSILLVIF